jgi:hypothetical protein
MTMVDTKKNWPKKMEDLPPVIQELMKKRGWTYPPSEEMKREWREAGERAAGSVHVDPEVLEMIWEEDQTCWQYRWKETDPEGYRRWKEEATARYRRWQEQQQTGEEHGR